MLWPIPAWFLRVSLSCWIKQKLHIEPVSDAQPVLPTTLLPPTKAPVPVRSKEDQEAGAGARLFWNSFSQLGGQDKLVNPISQFPTRCFPDMGQTQTPKSPNLGICLLLGLDPG